LTSFFFETMENSIFKNYNLKKLNTFNIDISSQYFCTLSTYSDFINIKDSDIYKINKKLIIGGGSNILFTKNFDGLIIKPDFKGIEIINENSDFVYIKAFAGENWDNFVNYCVDKNWYGIENLSLIPGNVGASPIQNIGAYGVEIKDVIHEVEYIDLEDFNIKTIENRKCNFDYRDSIFKNELKDKFIIISVTFKLSKNQFFNTNYKDIKLELENFKTIDLKNIRQAIINIRNRKLPKVEEIGSAGSFFKNPIISIEHFNDLLLKFPDIQSYKLDNNYVKIPAAWLIEKSGFKGYKFKNAGIYDKHALILVNYGNSTGSELLELANKIINDVKNNFNLELKPEVNIV